MGLCVLYYIEYSLYNVKKVGFFLSGLELHFNYSKTRNIYTVGLCVLYYVEYSLYIFLSGLELHFNNGHMKHAHSWQRMKNNNNNNKRQQV